MKIILIVLGILLIVLYCAIMFLYLIADYFKPLQKIYCKIGWHCHMKDYVYIGSDGASSHCVWKWCGYKGKIDSQGNLF